MWDWQSTIAKELNDSQDLKHKCCVAKSRCTILYDISVSRRNNFTALKKHISLLSSRVLRTEQDLFPGTLSEKRLIPGQAADPKIDKYNWFTHSRQLDCYCCETNNMGPQKNQHVCFFHYPLQTASKPKLFICDIDNHDLCHRLP